MFHTDQVLARVFEYGHGFDRFFTLGEHKPVYPHYISPELQSEPPVKYGQNDFLRMPCAKYAVVLLFKLLISV